MRKFFVRGLSAVAGYTRLRSETNDTKASPPSEPSFQVLRKIDVKSKLPTVNIFSSAISEISSGVKEDDKLQTNSSKILNSAHLLSQLDDQIVGTILHEGETFNVRVITSYVAARKHQENLKILAPIAYETRTRLRNRLAVKYEIEPDAVRLERPNENSGAAPNLDGILESDFFQKRFSSESRDNHTAILIEDKEGKAVSAISFFLNSEEQKQKFEHNSQFISRNFDNSLPLVFLDNAQTLPEYEGKGLLKVARTYFIPKILADCGIGGDEGKVNIASVTKRLRAENTSTGEVIYDSIPNFGVLSSSIEAMDNGSDKAMIFERWRQVELNSDGTIKKIDPCDHMRDEDEGRKLSEFVTKNKKGKYLVDENKLHEWIESSKKNEPTKFLEGCYYVTEVDVKELVSRRDSASSNVFPTSARLLSSGKNIHSPSK